MEKAERVAIAQESATDKTTKADLNMWPEDIDVRFILSQYSLDRFLNKVFGYMLPTNAILQW